MVGIEVRKQGEEGVLVELRGEFDRHNLENLQETLNDMVALGQSTLVDLSGVTFLDVGTSRELAIRSLLYAHLLALRNPSWQVRASMVACGFGAWADFRSDRPPAYPRLLSKEPLKAVGPSSAQDEKWERTCGI